MPKFYLTKSQQRRAQAIEEARKIAKLTDGEDLPNIVVTYDVNQIKKRSRKGSLVSLIIFGILVALFLYVVLYGEFL
ncbi:MAG: hypothetical protein LBC35_06230 [Coriobacteriales bacterium]|jgi:hypothetical protein|nr:hypothetical protein [Coriobacteriales bacterium]